MGDESRRHVGLHPQPASRVADRPCACCRCPKARRCSTSAVASASSLRARLQSRAARDPRGGHRTAIRRALEELIERARARRLFAPGSTVGFCQGDVRDLVFDDEAFDLVFVRELLQFLIDPVQAVREVHRVLRPGGYACVSDTDDQLHLTWPPRAPALERMVGAVSDVQHARGGDRRLWAQALDLPAPGRVRHRLGGRSCPKPSTAWSTGHEGERALVLAAAPLRPVNGSCRPTP